MRQFKETIFMGSGYFSLGQCYKLHKRLDEGLELLGGLQQPIHPESKEQKRKLLAENKRLKHELEDIIEDLKTALTLKAE